VKLIAVFLLTLATSSIADNPFACVDEDTMDAFFGFYSRAPDSFSTSVPDEFPPLVVPEGFSLVGSHRANSTILVAYKSSKDVETAFNLGLNEFSQQGWQETTNDRYRSRSFVSDSMSRGTYLCKAQGGALLGVNARQQNGKTFLLLSYSTEESPMCGNDRQDSGIGDSSDLMALLPELKLPGGIDWKNKRSGGSGHSVNSWIDLFGALSKQELQTDFEAQIEAQGWERQSSWTSEYSTGSIWLKGYMEDRILVGTLHLFDHGVDPIRARFSIDLVHPLDEVNYGSWGSSYSDQ